MNDYEDFYNELKKLALTTPEEERHLNGILETVKREIPLEFVEVLVPIAILYANAGIKSYIEFLYAMMAIGYSVCDDEDMDKPHKFSINDFLENK